MEEAEDNRLPKRNQSNAPKQQPYKQQINKTVHAPAKKEPVPKTSVKPVAAAHGAPQESGVKNQDTAAKPHYHLIDAGGFHMPTRHEAIVPISVIAGLVGVLAGTLPASLWVLIFRFSFAPMYLLLPILIWLSLRIFKGFTGRYGAIVTAVFSLPGLYLTLLSCQAADHILRFRMSVFNLPLVTAAMIGQSGSLPGTAMSSAVILPVVFTAIGLLAAYELFRHDEERLAAQT